MENESLIFYHYTSQEAATEIMLSGEILPSEASNGDAAFGDGVYLTTMEPQYGAQAVIKNNWGGAVVSMEKLEVFFEIQMPSTKAVWANVERDILVHEGVLKLRDYKWILKDWDGNFMATQYYRISSSGRAKERRGYCMGRYTLYQYAVLSYAGLDQVPVYKHDDGKFYLFLNSYGEWCVSDVIGAETSYLKQVTPEDELGSYAPSKSLPWRFSSSDAGWEEDATLKVFPCYLKE